MTLTTTTTPHEGKAVLSTETFTTLIERLEKAMRPLDGASYGPDHARVRDLYTNLWWTGTGDPLVVARRAVLYEILYGMIRREETEKRGA